MPEDMPEDMPEHMPEDMPDRMPDRMPEDMSDRMPEDLPVRKCINVMVGIIRSEVIFSIRFFNFIQWTWQVEWIFGHLAMSHSLNRGAKLLISPLALILCLSFLTSRWPVDLSWVSLIQQWGLVTRAQDLGSTISKNHLKKRIAVVGMWHMPIFIWQELHNINAQ